MRLVSLFAVVLYCSLAAGQDRSLVERHTIRGQVFKQPPEIKAPMAIAQASAKAQAKEWVEKRANKEHWSISTFEYRGQYSGEMTDGRDWQMYKMTVHPPVTLAKSPYGELWFCYEADKLVRPLEQHAIDQPPTQPPALVQWAPAIKSTSKRR